jgi:hypothetical protein
MCSSKWRTDGLAGDGWLQMHSWMPPGSLHAWTHMRAARAIHGPRRDSRLCLPIQHAIHRRGLAIPEFFLRAAVRVAGGQAECTRVAGCVVDGWL